MVCKCISIEWLSTLSWSLNSFWYPLSSFIQISLISYQSSVQICHMMLYKNLKRKGIWFPVVNNPVLVLIADFGLISLFKTVFISQCHSFIAGCGHEFCTRCALYLCSTNIAITASGPPGSIPCPLCRKAIVSFARIPGTSPAREPPRTSLSLSLCTTCPAVGSEPRDTSTNTQLCKPDFNCAHMPPLGSSSLRSLSCQKFPSMKFNSALCMGAPETSSCLIKCSRSGLSRSASQGESSSRRSWLFSFNQLYVTTGSSS